MIGRFGSQDKSRKYSAVKTRIFIAGVIINICSLLVFQVFASGKIAEYSFRVFTNFYLASGLYAIFFLLFMYFVSLPIHLTGSFVVEKKYNLSRQTFSQWAGEEMKSLVLTMGLTLICIEVFYFILRFFPVYWWVIAALAWIFFTLILARILPVLIIPIFFKYMPMENYSLKQRIVDLAEAAGVSLFDVCLIDFSRKTSKANAALVGLGATRKVVLADTLVSKFTDEEILTVVAHEIGHHRYGHIGKLLMFGAVVNLAGFFVFSRLAAKIMILAGADYLYDFRILPSLILLTTISGLIILPFQNYYSRRLERQADSFALQYTGDKVSFISVMEKLASMNLAERNPSLPKKIFMYNHPPISERVRFAEGFGSE